MLYGSSLAPLRTAAAARDVSLLQSVIETFPADVRDVARRGATTLFAPDSAGKPESEDQVHVVSALARVLGVERDESMIADGGWKDEAWEDYFQSVRDDLDDRARELFGLLAHKNRPLFGTSIQTSWSYYGYLLLNEVRELLAALERLQEARPEVASPGFIDGFHSELVGWLRQVVDRQTDLWLFAS